MKASPRLRPLLWSFTVVAAFIAGRYSQSHSQTEAHYPAGQSRQHTRADPLTSPDAKSASAQIPDDLDGKETVAIMVTPKGQSPKLVSLEVPGVSSARLAEFADILTLSNATERHRRFATLLDSMNPAEAKAMRRLFHNLGANGNHFYVEWYEFWERWGQIDPAAALADTAQGDPRENWVRDCARDTLKGWASQNPNAAAEWLNSHRDNPLFEAAFTGYITGIGDRDLSQATQTATATLAPGDPLLNVAMQKLAEIAVARGQLTGLSRWFDQLPGDTGDGSARRVAVEHVWRRFQLSENVERTAEWVLTTASQSWRSDKCIIETARLYADRSPSNAMTWVSSLPPSPIDGRVSGVDQVARRWLQQDPSAFEEWLRSETRPEISDQACAAYVAELKKNNPDVAKTWASTIRNEQMRAAAMASFQQ